MNYPVYRKLSIFAIPAVVLPAAWLVFPLVARLPPAAGENALYISYALFVPGLFLSIHFNRGRAFLAQLMLLLSFWSMRWFPSPILFKALSLLLPFNLAVISIMREKGVMTLSGRMRLAFIAIQGALVAWLTVSGPLPLPVHAGHDTIWHMGAAHPALPRYATPVTAVALLLTAVRAYLGRNPIDCGLFGALCAVAANSLRVAAGDLSALYLVAGGVIINLEILRESHNLAFRDDLTGLPSRRALNEDMAGLGRGYVIAMLDVDHFKKVNDTHGHGVGDQVLRMVGSKIRSAACGGKAYRYGGEEFALVFRKKGVDEVIPILENLRKKIALYRLWIRDKDRPERAREGKSRRGPSQGERYISVTVSMGVAERSGWLKSPEEVIRAADQALYRAKNGGRNRICG